MQGSFVRRSLALLGLATVLASFGLNLDCQAQQKTKPPKTDQADKKAADQLKKIAEKDFKAQEATNSERRLHPPGFGGSSLRRPSAKGRERSRCGRQRRHRQRLEVPRRPVDHQDHQGQQRRHGEGHGLGRPDVFRQRCYVGLSPRLRRPP